MASAFVDGGAASILASSVVVILPPPMSAKNDAQHPRRRVVEAGDVAQLRWGVEVSHWVGVLQSESPQPCALAMPRGRSYRGQAARRAVCLSRRGHCEAPESDASSSG